MPKFEVIFETPLYFSAFVDADDVDDAASKAMDYQYPTELHLPNSFEADQDSWFVGGVVRVRDED